jgi:hypothetical protein
MGPMRRTAALAFAVGLVLTAEGCTKDPPRMPRACTDTSRDGYERALAAAPRGRAVRLPGGVTISTCTRRVRSDAELQNLGTVVHGVAEALADRAAGGDAAAALELGFLVGAIGVGAERSNGIAAELARRVESTTARVVDGPKEVTAALARGGEAGRARG